MAGKGGGKNSAAAQEPELRCHLHRKPNKSCKFCQRVQDAKQAAEEARAAASKKVEAAAQASKKKTFNCSQLLRDQVLDTSYYRNLETVNKIDELIEELREYASTASDTLNVYRAPTEPSGLMIHTYRLFTLGVEEFRLRQILDDGESIHVRCMGFLYLRFTLPPEDLWATLEDFLLDQDLLNAKDEEQELGTTIGEYIEGLLLKEKYFNLPLPRIPVLIRKKIEEQLAPYSQHRKRSAANFRYFSPGVGMGRAVEALVDGQWRPGKVVKFIDKVPTRVKLQVAFGEDGEEKADVHIGHVVLADEPQKSRSRSRSGGRSRQKSSAEPDWSRCKGRSDTEMVEELRERAKDNAVCNDRSKFGYSKRPLCFEGSLAIKRDQGSEELRLNENDNQSKPKERRSKAEEEEEEEERSRQKRRRTDEEEERQRKLKDIYEKYGRQKSSGPSRSSDMDKPDVMRLG